MSRTVDDGTPLVTAGSLCRVPADRDGPLLFEEAQDEWSGETVRRYVRPARRGETFLLLSPPARTDHPRIVEHVVLTVDGDRMVAMGDAGSLEEVTP